LTFIRASGHVDRFTDLMVKDLKTHDYMRADHLLEEHLSKLMAQKNVPSHLLAEYESVISKVEPFLFFLSFFLKKRIIITQNFKLD